MSLLVGCPVRRRAWVLPEWREAVLAAHRASGGAFGDLGLVFVADRGDRATFDLVSGWPETVEVVDAPRVDVPRPDVRTWSLERFGLMVALRTALLGAVRGIGPEWFWSLDSDVLAHPGVLVSLADAVEQVPGAWAYGSKLHMIEDPGNRSEPSFGSVRGASFVRWDESRLASSVDAIMASKLMRPAAYAVDYVFDRGGEDVGWSRAVRAAGGSLAWDGRVCSKHVMSPPRLFMTDPRVGF